MNINVKRINKIKLRLGLLENSVESFILFWIVRPPWMCSEVTLGRAQGIISDAGNSTRGDDLQDQHLTCCTVLPLLHFKSVVPGLGEGRFKRQE